MPTSDIRAVLFDVDGTLIDTWDLYIEAYLQTLEHFLKRRLTFQELKTLGPTSELGFFERAVGAPLASVAHQRFLATYSALHGSHFGGVYDGVLPAIARLHNAKIPIGIVTGKSRRAWDVTTGYHELGTFGIVLTDDDVPRPKPAPDGLLLAADALGVEAGHVIYVGDGTVDAQAAGAAHMRFAAAMWPKAEHERTAFLDRVRAAGVWQAFETPGDLVAAVLDQHAG